MSKQAGKQKVVCIASGGCHIRSPDALRCEGLAQHVPRHSCGGAAVPDASALPGYAGFSHHLPQCHLHQLYEAQPIFQGLSAPPPPQVFMILYLVRACCDVFCSGKGLVMDSCHFCDLRGVSCHRCMGQLHAGSPDHMLALLLTPCANTTARQLSFGMLLQGAEV